MTAAVAVVACGRGVGGRVVVTRGRWRGCRLEEGWVALRVNNNIYLAGVHLRSSFIENGTYVQYVAIL